jgi:putative chitinase
MLKIGSRGENVRKLQRYLGATPDGIFGVQTKRFVMEWQLKNGLNPDGVITDEMWFVMYPPQQKFKLNNLMGHIPKSVIDEIPDTAKNFNITTPLRLAHFLAQCAHESGNFRLVLENLNYSAEGLRRVFPKSFPGDLSESYARQPERIANRVYASRMGNGDEVSGDGWRFRGRGYIQLTGKNNYAIFNTVVKDDVIKNPDLVATKYPLMSAAYFFNRNNLWVMCDRGSDDKAITTVTRVVNGGVTGLDDRIRRFRLFHRLLT